MWRSLLERLLPIKSQQAGRPAGHPVVAHATPIGPKSRNEVSSHCTHTHQDSNNNCKTCLPEREPFPECGSWSPSPSFVSTWSNDLPWTTASAREGNITPPGSPNGENYDDYPVTFCGAYPLKRVLTIGRREGDCIRKRRKIYKMISPKELVDGLGFMLMDRATDIYFEVVRREGPVQETRIPRIIVEEFDDDDDDW